MSSNISVLDIFLHDQPIATLTNLSGDKNLLTFNEDYINNPQRSPLSQSFKDLSGELITNPKSTRTRLLPFFSNLLPEGHLSDAELLSSSPFPIVYHVDEDAAGCGYPECRTPS